MRKFCAKLSKEDKKKSIFSINFVLLGLAIFFVCNRNFIVSEVKNFLHVFNLESLETILAVFALPSKTVIEIGQLLGVMCLLEIAFIIGTIIYFLVLFFATKSKKIISIKNHFAVRVNDDTENDKYIYKQLGRFLC